MLQDEFADFIALWNGHKIRTQKNRQHVISGRPIDLYNTNDVRNWGVLLSDSESGDDRQALRTMLEPLEDIDIDSFLQEETEAWCVSQLTEMGFFNEELNNYQRPFITSYINLRQRI